MSSEFSLRALVLEVWSETDSEDREQIVKEIELRIPPALVPEALRQALPAFIHSSTSHRWPELTEADGDSKAPPLGRSSKVGGIRDSWRRYLEGRYTVEDGSVRRFGDLRRDDLIFLARDLEAQARKKHARSVSMKSLAAAMSEHGAERVRDLPSDYLAEFLGGHS